jgi:hypothetical protein
LTFFTELERLVDGHGPRHAISTTATGRLEIRLGAGDWYMATQIAIEDDPIKAAQSVADAQKYFPDRVSGTCIELYFSHETPVEGQGTAT